MGREKDTKKAHRLVSFLKLNNENSRYLNLHLQVYIFFIQLVYLIFPVKIVL